MILSVTLSKPAKNVSEKILGRPYIRIKIRANTSSAGLSYFAEYFTEKQSFHEQLSEQQLSDLLKKTTGSVFKNCVTRTETEIITTLANKKGEITELRRKVKSADNSQEKNSTAFGGLHAVCTSVPQNGFNRQKKYLLPEGTPVPFLVLLGVMTPEGKVISSKYDKFRQINRFLEFIDDIIDDVRKVTENENRSLRIADFGCGKSYLTFAVHYYLTQIKKIPVEITGLDLKEDVIAYCNKTAQQLNCKGLHFATGNIADYHYENNPDLVITLHACDTATDFALDYAVKHNCKAILCVPCCQHEINMQLDEYRRNSEIKNQLNDSPFAPLLKYGIIKERFAALATDALRAEYLENAGYTVRLLEFIDMEHTPKNILIRAVKENENRGLLTSPESLKEADSLTDALHVSQKLRELLKD